MEDLTPAQLSAPRPWSLVDESNNAHPSVSIRSPGRKSPVAFKYAPLPHEVADFAHMVDCVNAMAGIPDPAAYVAAMGAAVEALEAVNDAYGWDDTGLTYEPVHPIRELTAEEMNAVHAALQAARAAMGERND